MTSETDAQVMTKDSSSMWGDLKFLVNTFDKKSRFLLIANSLAQFFLALMDLLGLAAIYPLMQVALGTNLNTGTLGDVHRLLGNQSKNSFALTLAALMAFSFIAKAVVASALTWWSVGLLTRLQTSTSRRLLERYMSEGYLEHRQRNTGEVIRTVGPAMQSAVQSVLGGCITALSSLMSVVLIAVLLLLVTPIPAICATLYFVVVVYVIQRILAPANRRAGETAQHTSWVMSKALIDAMQGFREANLHNAREFFVDQYDEGNLANAAAARRANFLSTMPKNLLELMTMLGLTILIVLSILWGNASSAMPVLSLFVASTIKILPLMVGLTATIGSIRYGRDGLHITVEALREADAEPTAHGATAVAPISNEPLPADADLAVSHVSFRYDTDSPWVLSDLTFDVPRGTSVAFCGPSGSGKTTLVDIILGLIPPTEGAVTYGGIRTDTRDPRWFDTVAYVPQDVYLVDDTLANNVAFGIAPEHQNRERIRECLERAELGDILAQLPEGIETEVGERGTRLSGGQKQRVGIARALYRDPTVIVFDEATSALDNVTEHKITKTINSLRGDITTVIVAHRLSTVRNVDRLAFLRNGHIEAFGTFDEVERESPAFARLVQLGRLDGETAEGSDAAEKEAAGDLPE